MSPRNRRVSIAERVLKTKTTKEEMAANIEVCAVVIDAGLRLDRTSWGETEISEKTIRGWK